MTVGTGGTSEPNLLPVKTLDKPVQQVHDSEARTIMAILGNLPVSGVRKVSGVTTIQCSENAVIACLRQAYRAGKKQGKE
jgi:hypothetical protein